MGLGIPPIELKILLESNPPKSMILVWRLAASQGRTPQFVVRASVGSMETMLAEGPLNTDALQTQSQEEYNPYKMS